MIVPLGPRRGGLLRAGPTRRPMRTEEPPPHETAVALRTALAEKRAALIAGQVDAVIGAFRNFELTQLRLA